MDKLMNNNWFLRIVSFLLALMLYASVNIESPRSDNDETNNLFHPSTSTETATLTDIPVHAYYDDRTFIVTGIPKTATVTIEGPKSIVTTTKQVKDFEIYADLTDLGIGTHTVRLQQKNLSDQLKVKIDPAVITVGIHKKATEKFPVEVDVLNKSKINEGYTVGEPIVSPSEVIVTGVKEDIEAIASVKVRVDLTGADDTIRQKVEAKAYDINGNILPVTVEPSIVVVTVPVTSPSKSVPLELKKTGKLPDGVNLLSIRLNPSRVDVYGPKEVLNEIDAIEGGTIHLSNIQDDATIVAEIPVPKGATKVVPNKVHINIDIEKQGEKTLAQLPVNVVGLRDDQSLEFIDPSTGKLDVVLKGKESVLKDIEESDIELYMNVANLGTGEHTVKVKAKVPDQITAVLSTEQIKIRISSNQKQSEETNGRQNEPTENNEEQEQYIEEGTAN